MFRISAIALPSQLTGGVASCTHFPSWTTWSVHFFGSIGTPRAASPGSAPTLQRGRSSTDQRCATTQLSAETKWYVLDLHVETGPSRPRTLLLLHRGEHQVSVQGPDWMAIMGRLLVRSSSPTMIFSGS